MPKKTPKKRLRDMQTALHPDPAAGNSRPPHYPPWRALSLWDQSPKSQPPSVRSEIDRQPEGRRTCIETLRNLATDRIGGRDIDPVVRRNQYMDLDESAASRLRDIAG